MFILFNPEIDFFCLFSDKSLKSHPSHAGKKMTSIINSWLLITSFVLFLLAINCRGESSTCLAVYKQGGAPAVFQSPKCPRWNLHNWGQSGAGRCHTAAIKGRRNYQEDRLLCALDLRIPFPGMEHLDFVSMCFVRPVELKFLVLRIKIESFIL